MERPQRQRERRERRGCKCLRQHESRASGRRSKRLRVRQKEAHIGGLRLPAADDKRPSVSTPDGGLLAAKSERVRLPNTSPNFRTRALSQQSFKFARCFGGSGRETRESHLLVLAHKPGTIEVGSGLIAVVGRVGKRSERNVVS
jgi:hypothetical protein